MPNLRTTENEFVEAVLRILSEEPNGEATQKRIRQRIPDFVDLTDADCAQSDTRPNEELWEQLVRNIVSHKNAVGYLKSPRREWLKITDTGRKRIS